MIELTAPPPPPEPRSLLGTRPTNVQPAPDEVTEAVAPPRVTVPVLRTHSFRNVETGELQPGTITCSAQHLAANTPDGCEAIEPVAESSTAARPEMDSDVHRRIDELETKRRLTERLARRSPATLAEVSALDDQIEVELDKLEARKALKAQRQS